MKLTAEQKRTMKARAEFWTKVERAAAQFGVEDAVMAITLAGPEALLELRARGIATVRTWANETGFNR